MLLILDDFLHIKTFDLTRGCKISCPISHSSLEKTLRVFVIPVFQQVIKVLNVQLVEVNVKLINNEFEVVITLLYQLLSLLLCYLHAVDLGIRVKT